MKSDSPSNSPVVSATDEINKMRMQRLTVLLLVATIVVLAALLTLRFGLGPAILLLAAGVLLLAVWLAFRAMQAALEPAEQDTLAEIPPSPAEARRRSAMRALRDLEYEKSVGNLGEEDFAQLVRQYRAEAKEAMRAVDQERKGARQRAEALIAKELGDESRPEKSKKEEAPSKKEKPKESKKEPKEQAKKIVEEPADADDDRVACAKCGTKNDRDARFCKQCAASLSASTGETP